MIKHKKYYITTPIYYVNDVPHIGHAYTSVAADVIARFNRMCGDDVFFLTGTDEHGQKVERSAIAKGRTPMQHVDELVSAFKVLLKRLDCTNNDFIRTTEDRHKSFVIKMWEKMIDRGDIYLGKYCGWYSTRAERFCVDSELVNGLLPDGSSVEWVEEESFFFKLSKWQEALLEFFDANPDFIGPSSRQNEIISFVKQGLRDLSVSRTTFNWGISVPNAPGHIIYVWIDALLNYISALGEDGAKKYWPCDLHVIGKDILIFHAVYWPAILMSLELPLPKRIFAHGWWLNNGEKISKSVGNVIDPIALIDEFGSDYVRYFILRESAFGQDCDYSRDALIRRVNGELVNNIGNLTQRVVTFVEKYCDNIIPSFTCQLSLNDHELLDLAYSTKDRIINAMSTQALHIAIGYIVDLGHASNVYIDKMAPWRLKNTDHDEMCKCIYVLLECVRVIAIFLQPFIPCKAKSMLDIFHLSSKMPKIDESYVSLCMASKEFAISAKCCICPQGIIFERIK